jgi:DNA-binding MarR family transcriptional regulator
MDDRIFFHLSRAENRLKTYMKNIFRENNINISPAQIGILFLLMKNNSQSMSELSRVLEIDNSAITRLVDNLEKMNLVKRDLNPGDRRQFLIFLTEEGEKEINKAKKIVRETNEKLKEDIPEGELAVFLRVINKLCINLGK